MSDFMAATAQEAGRRLIELGLRKVAEIPGGKPTLEQALTILRDVTVDPTNTVMYELAVAARTDEKLRDTLRDVMTLYIKTIQETVRPSLPEEFEAAGDAEFLARLALVLSSFNGAALFGHVLTEPGFGEAQIPLLMRLLNAARP
jgi:hypothetical protein